MNEFNIGATILRLRKEKGITQEKLADMIGVSAGAVSKWETGNSKPDIDLLAPLARVLNTSLNQLLSFKDDLLESEIKEIHKEITDIFLHHDFTEGELKCKEYLNKYPNSVGLKLTIAGLIYMYSMLLDADLFISKIQYALPLLYQVVDSKEVKYVHTALFLIANIQMKLENYNESDRCLKELRESFVDPMISYASLLHKQGKNKEAESFCKGMLLMYLNQSNAMMSILSKISKCENNFDKAVLYLESVNKVENIFKIGLHSGAYNLCRLYIEEGKKEEAAKWFKYYVEALLSTEYDYDNNPYFENLQLEINTEGQNVMRKKLFQTLIDEEELKVLSGFSEYIQSIEKLKIAVK